MHASRRCAPGVCVCGDGCSQVVGCGRQPCPVRQFLYYIEPAAGRLIGCGGTGHRAPAGRLRQTTVLSYPATPAAAEDLQIPRWPGEIARAARTGQHAVPAAAPSRRHVWIVVQRGHFKWRHRDPVLQPARPHSACMTQNPCVHRVRAVRSQTQWTVSLAARNGAAASARHTRPRGPPPLPACRACGFPASSSAS